MVNSYQQVDSEQESLFVPVYWRRARCSPLTQTGDTRAKATSMHFKLLTPFYVLFCFFETGSSLAQADLELTV